MSKLESTAKKPHTSPSTSDKNNTNRPSHETTTAAAAEAFGSWSWTTPRQKAQPQSPAASPGQSHRSKYSSSSISSLLKRLISHDNDARPFSHKRDSVNDKQSPFSFWRRSTPRSFLRSLSSLNLQSGEHKSTRTDDIMPLQPAPESFKLHATNQNDHMYAAAELSSRANHTLDVDHHCPRELLNEAMCARDLGQPENCRALCLRIINQPPKANDVRCHMLACNILATQASDSGQAHHYLDMASKLVRNYVSDRHERIELLHVVAMLREHAHSRDRTNLTTPSRR